MLKELKVGTNYYFKVTIPTSQTDTPDHTTDIQLSPTTKYRVNGGSWQTRSGTFNFAYNGANETYIYNDGTWHTLTQNDVIEFTGTLTFVSSIIFPFLKDLLLKSGIENPYEIRLYQNKSDDKVVSKSLTLIETLYGALREETNVLTPSILVETGSRPLNFNFVYIPNFGRSYYLMNTQLVRNGIYRLDLKVDVLDSYDSDIREQQGFISRNEFTYNDMLMDDRYPYKPELFYGYMDVNSLYPTPQYNCVNVSFTNLAPLYSYVLSAINPTYINQDYNGIVEPPTNSDLPRVNYASAKVRTLFTMDVADANHLICAVRSSSSQASYVNSIVQYPFDVSSVCVTTTKTIRVNDKYLSSTGGGTWKTTIDGTQVDGKEIEWCNMGYLIIADFTYTITDSYKEREPYKYYELWIPFVGWIKLEPSQFFNERCIVYYAVDIDSGMATAYFKKWSADSPYFSAPCQIGIKIPTSTTNEEELTRQKQNNVLNLAVGLIGSGVSTGIGVASGNPVAIAGGVLSATKTIASSVNANNMLFERAQTSLFSSETSMYGNITKVMLKVSYRESATYNDTLYAHIQGKPLNDYRYLNSLSGYTEIPELHYVPVDYNYITKTEIDEIISLARDGIIL